MGLTFDTDLWLNDLNINKVIYSSRNIYLPSLKFLGPSVLELSVAQGEEDWHDLWPAELNINRGHLHIKDYLPTKFEAFLSYCTRWSILAWPLTFTWISIGIIYSSRTIYLPSLKLLGQRVLELSVAQGEVYWHDLWLWPTDLNINRDHLLIKTYLPTWGKVYLSYQLHKVKGDRPTDGHVQRIMPSFFNGGLKYLNSVVLAWKIILFSEPQRIIF